MDISIVETDDKYLYELHGQHLAINCTLGKVKDCKNLHLGFKSN